MLCTEFRKNLTFLSLATRWRTYGNFKSPFLGLTTRSSADADNRRDAFSGQSRSTNTVPFHILGIVSYCAIVTLSFLFTIFDFKNVVTLKSGSEVTQSHWKWQHSIDCVWFPILVFLSNLSLKRTVFEIFNCKNAVTLKTELGSVKVIWNITLR